MEQDSSVWKTTLSKSRNFIWEYWCKAIGSKAYEDEIKSDRVAIIRSVWVLLHIVTCLFIIVGNGRVLGLWQIIKNNLTESKRKQTNWTENQTNIQKRYGQCMCQLNVCQRSQKGFDYGKIYTKTMGQNSRIW